MLSDVTNSWCSSRLERSRAALRDNLAHNIDTTPAPSPVSSTAFPQFALLPAEIRLQIWEEALPGPRAVLLRSPIPSRAERLFRGRREKTRPAVWTSPTRVPAMLHVSREARDVALGRYELALGCGEVPGRVYLDLDRDCVALSAAELESRCDDLWRQTQDLGRVRHLAATYWGFERFLHFLNACLWDRFAVLEDITVAQSLRWQCGRLPAAADADFPAWIRREREKGGIVQWRLTGKGRFRVEKGPGKILDIDLGDSIQLIEQG